MNPTGTSLDKPDAGRTEWMLDRNGRLVRLDLRRRESVGASASSEAREVRWRARTNERAMV